MRRSLTKVYFVSSEGAKGSASLRRVGAGDRGGSRAAQAPPCGGGGGGGESARAAPPAPGTSRAGTTETWSIRAWETARFVTKLPFTREARKSTILITTKLIIFKNAD